MTILEHPILAGTMKQVTASELAGPCPFCGGTDRFRFWPAEGATGRWMCRGCGRQGDGIQFLRDMEGLSYPDACKRLGTTPKVTETPRARKPIIWEPKSSVLPGEAWIARAGQFVERCAATLAAGGPGMEYARGRGLTAKTCAALRIGWNPSNLYEDRAVWGLPDEINPKTGKPRRVWLPSGLVIPTLRDGRVVAIKIRRAEWTPEDQLPKYTAASGGGKLPMVLARARASPALS